MRLERRLAAGTVTTCIGAACVIIAAAWSGIAAAAEAGERGQRTVYVSSGRETRIAYYGSPGKDCRVSPKPRIAVVAHPSYGKITLRPDRILARPGSVPARAKRCIGKFVDMTAVFYKPAPRFHGSDRVLIHVVFGTPADGTLDEEIYLSVR